MDTDKNIEAQKLLESYNIFPEQITRSNKNSTEYISVFSTIVIEANGSAEIIPFITSSKSLEYDIAVRLFSLNAESKPVVNILFGNGKSASDDYDYLVLWLTSQGFFVKEIYIENLFENSGTLLVIGENEFLENDVAQIEKYILLGNDAIFLASPFSINLYNDWEVSRNENNYLCEMLENWGVYFLDSILVSEQCEKIKMISEDQSATFIDYPFWIKLPPQKNAQSGINLFWATPLEFFGNASPFFQTGENCEARKIDSESEKLLETNPFFVTSSKNLSEQFYPAGQIYGEIKGRYFPDTRKNAKIFVIADQFFVSTLANSYLSSRDYKNFDTIVNALLKLNGYDSLAALQEKTISDKGLYKKTELKDFQRFYILTLVLNFVIVPILIILFSICINLYKKLRVGVYEKK